MRTKVIPAQITTVEDKIAGNFSLTQIIILLSPVFLATTVFALLPPVMTLTWFKLLLVAFTLILSVILALRLKGKLIVHWIIILLRYNLRPKYYVFNKNEASFREQVLPIKKESDSAKEKVVQAPQAPIPEVKVSDLIQLEELVSSKNVDIRFKTAKKGGLHVAFEKIRK